MRRLRRLAVVVVILVGLATLGLWLASRSATIRTLVHDQIVAALRAALGEDVTIGAVGGTLGRSLVLEDLRISAGGRALVRVPRIEIAYAPLALLRGRLRLTRIQVDAPSVRVVQGTPMWQPPASQGGGLPIQIDHLGVEGGRVAVAHAPATPWLAATDLRLVASAWFGAGSTQVRVTRLAFRPRGVAVSPVEASGDLRLRRDGSIEGRALRLVTSHSRIEVAGRLRPGVDEEARLALLPLDAAEVRALAPASGLRATLHATVDVAGPWSRVGADMTAAMGRAGQLRAAGTVDLEHRPLDYSGTVSFTGLDPEAIRDGLPAGHLTGHARLRGRDLGRATTLRYGVVLAPSVLSGQQLTAAKLSGNTRRAVTHA